LIIVRVAADVVNLVVAVIVDAAANVYNISLLFLLLNKLINKFK
jgi:hypothetical protein